MRAELAAAVLPGPRILFLDEPTIGLDIEAKAAVREFLRELNAAEGTTAILTTHDLDDIAELCSRLMIIDHGRIVYDGTIDALHAAYGSTRMLIVDLADPSATLTPGPGWAGAQVVRAEGHRRWIRFARDQVSAADLVALVLAEHQVLDLSIVEPDIEDVIRRIYRGEARPAEGP
jgi:ABC-2 type transport system ATP-binding protein